MTAVKTMIEKISNSSLLIFIAFSSHLLFMKPLPMTSGPCDPTAAADDQYLSSVERRRFARGRADAQTGTTVELHPLVHKTREQVLYSLHAHF
jgi:hypothetical protein